jgi:pimeloyl-ACP methyl ester carboxylesterase
MVERVPYDEFGLFHENALEYGIVFVPPVVRREFVEVEPGRRLSALVWQGSHAPGTRGPRSDAGDGPEFVFIHGGAQNAHTWDTVALALGRPIIAIDLPGHGHSDPPGSTPGGQLSITSNADDVAKVVEALAPNAIAVIGMSLGGLTTISFAARRPDLVRRAVIVDVTPGVNGVKSQAIAAFVNGPATFPSFEDLLARTIEHNPTRTESSLRRGILHNAIQLDDGSWVWRYRRNAGHGVVGEANETARPDWSSLWDDVASIRQPLMLVRGLLAQSVVDDDDEAEFVRRAPHARVEHIANAGHSVQGDTPIELARLIADFAG